MRIPQSTLVKGALAAIAATALMAAASGAVSSEDKTTVTKTSVVCNRWNECWKVKEHYTTYPADMGVVSYDQAWYDAHQHDTHWRWLSDPANDKGWYDKEGAWHAFPDTPPTP